MYRCNGARFSSTSNAAVGVVLLLIELIIIRQASVCIYFAVCLFVCLIILMVDPQCITLGESSQDLPEVSYLQCYTQIFNFLNKWKYQLISPSSEQYSSNNNICYVADTLYFHTHHMVNGYTSIVYIGTFEFDTLFSMHLMQVHNLLCRFPVYILLLRMCVYVHGKNENYKTIKHINSPSPIHRIGIGSHLGQDVRASLYKHTSIYLYIWF